MKTTSLQILTFFTLVTSNALSYGNIVKSDEKCILKLNDNKLVLKNIDETWISPNDPCITFTCILDNNRPFIKEIIKSCDIYCENEYELQKLPNQCCGKCVKTKCNFNNDIHNIGDVWKSDDNCTFNECALDADNKPAIDSYRKSCPKLQPCHPNNIYLEDCCQYCNTTQKNKEGKVSNENSVDIMNYETYKIHPCHRDCIEGAEPMTCSYTFVLESYETLSKACYDCPHNVTDCYRPHCITGDGTRRSIVVVNRMMPGPPIEVCQGDTIVVDVVNHLLGDSTTMHWHGLHQRNNPYMDGVPHVSQCPIPPHTTFRYTFEADNPGTHFYHSHTGMQRGDGCYGAMIIRQPKTLDRHAKLFDYDMSEHFINLQDWAHVPGLSMFVAHHYSIGDNKPPSILINGRGRYFERQLKQQAAAPSTSSPMDAGLVNSAISDEYLDLVQSSTNIEVETTESEEEATTIFSNEPPAVLEPKVMLLNSRQKRAETEENRMAPLEVYTVNKGFRYRFRLINAEFLNCPMELSIDDHNLTVISSDGFDLKPMVVSSLVSYAGERFDFILNTNQNVDSYWFRIRGLMDCDERFTSAYQVAILRYNGAPDREPVGTPIYNYLQEGLQMNALNRGTGHNDTISIAELTSADLDDPELLRAVPDYKFYIYYDFYRKDNPNFHVPGLYGFNQVQNSSNRVLTPQLNHISMKMPSTPLMLAKDQIDDSAFCNATSLEDQGIDCTQVFCECSHVLQVRLNSVVEMLLVDEGMAYDANHPFHLHGNAFRVVAMERLARNITIDEVKSLDEAGGISRRLKGAPLKDTITVPDGGYTIIRFKADNPGYWLFHCHIEFHAEIGMSLVLKVGEHNEMKPVPKNFPMCSDYMPDTLSKLTDASLSSGAERSSQSVLLVFCLMMVYKIFL